MKDQHSGPRHLFCLRSAAALVGLGTAFAVGAQANQSSDVSHEARRGHASPRDRRDEIGLHVRDGDIFLSQKGCDLGKVNLANTPAAETLRSLLENSMEPHTQELRLSAPMVVADGAGGVAWPRSTQPPKDGSRSGTASTERPGSQHRTTAVVPADPARSGTGGKKREVAE
jgi:hypothetical protein